MNRRSFLSMLGVGTAATIFDPERLLWVPGAKSIFIPKPYVPTTFVDVVNGVLGFCNGIPIPLKAVVTDTIGPLFEDGGSLYRLIELKPDNHICWHDSMIFAVPGGKLQVMVKRSGPKLYEVI